MKDKIIITERNRDGAKIWLEKVENEENIYTIHTTEDKKFCLEYATLTHMTLPDDADDYDDLIPYKTLKIESEKFNKVINMSYDPSGGPYLAVGCQIDEYKLTRIFVRDKKFYFKLCEDKNNAQ